MEVMNVIARDFHSLLHTQVHPATASQGARDFTLFSYKPIFKHIHNFCSFCDRCSVGVLS